MRKTIPKYRPETGIQKYLCRRINCRIPFSDQRNFIKYILNDSHATPFLLRKSLSAVFLIHTTCSTASQFSHKKTSPGKSQETKNFPRFHSCESIDADTYAVYTAGDNANQRAMLLYSHSQLPDALPVSLHEAGFQPGPALSDISCDSTLSVQSLFEAFLLYDAKISQMSVYSLYYSAASFLVLLYVMFSDLSTFFGFFAFG